MTALGGEITRGTMLCPWKLVVFLAGTLTAVAQGTVHFTTKLAGVVDAPVIYGENRELVTGTGSHAIMGQLYAGTPGGFMMPVGVPIPFRSDADRGYITTGGEVLIPGTVPGGSAHVQLVAWWVGMGSTFAEALSEGRGNIGLSAVIAVNGLGGGTIPPAPLTGLQGFSISAIPEASTSSLALLGAALLALRFKKHR